ncbi:MULTISPECIES: DegT/DnrJ/EryC1/StrS family aminotransferase [Brasilonema]|uniref:DegT/DnrJ/EryC1/StrS family aminotransferase n=1 Tax=Brasilonema TaxID=383614 RepID=UPI001B7D0EAC|nr:MULTISPECIES: DegT/DnrJ/EryC1/StrS family aminotransferase [Brasilonema]
MSNWHIPLSDLDYGSEETMAVQRVLQSKWLSMGPEVQAFEQEFAEFLGVKHAIAVANGTAALHLSYLALGLEPGDEIIQPAINFVAAANMAVAIGVKPVFADIIGLNEPTIDPADIERCISPRTKAVVVMHYGGYPCRMAEIQTICQQYGLVLIEDACHAVGARYLDSQAREPHGNMVGTLGDIACFSFFSNKNLATGEGGLVTTNRDNLAERLRLLRSHGMTTLSWERHKGHASSYDVILHGYNYRLDELRAALGRVQLRKLKRNNSRRQQIVLAYQKHLTPLSGWTVPFWDYLGDSAHHLMALVAPDRETRTHVVKALKQAGIQTSFHYPCLADFTAFRHLTSHDLEQSRLFAQSVITLPLFPTMTTDQVEQVCSHIYEFSSLTKLKDDLH